MYRKTAADRRKTGILDILPTMLPLIGSMAALLIIYTADGGAGQPPEKEGHAGGGRTVLTGKYPVAGVVDGDTIKVSIDGEPVTVRLAGIDAPESVHPDRERNVPEGLLSSRYLKDLLEGETVYLEYDADTTDGYGRTLAYVWLNPERMVNLMVIENGFAEPFPVEPNVRYRHDFQAAYDGTQ